MTPYKNGQASIVLRLKLLDSSSSVGAGLTGLTSASSGLIISTIADNEAAAIAYTVAGSTIETISTLGTYAAPTATKCRFKEVDATNHKGVYELHLADARYAVANAKSLLISIAGAANLAQADYVVPLVVDDPYAAKLDAAGTRTAVGLASANLDTQIAAIAAKTGNLSPDPADASDIAALFTALPAAVRDVNNTSPAVSSLGAAVNSAASAGDPWSTALPGSYAAGTAGYKLAGVSTGMIEALASLQNAKITMSDENTGTIQIYTPGTAQTGGNLLRTIPISRPDNTQPFALNRVS